MDTQHFDAQTLYKLIVLYALSRVPHPLTKAQLTDFFLEKDYTGYLTLQTVFAQLLDAGFISQERTRNRTQLLLTEEGKNTLLLFDNELTQEIKKDVDAYLSAHAGDLREVVSVTSDYALDPAGKEYLVKLRLLEHNRPLLNLELSFPTEAIAEAV